VFFLLDHDIDAAVARLLRSAGHKCETASTVGLATADDDQVSVFADNHQAILITHDKEAIRRRIRNTFGRHVWLACNDLDAVEVVTNNLTEILAMIMTREAIVLRVSKEGVAPPYPTQWE
jgi:predicted nuclease of predicted toxin-antitoxin system